MPYPRSWSTTRILLLFTLSSYGTRFANSLKIDGTWISPQYNYIFDFPVPFPVVKTPKFTYTNEDGADIDYYEVEVTSVESQIYPDLKATPLVGYDGTSPGPMFVMQRGREAVVRFTNNGPLNMAVHVHGQYNRAPFDGWAGDYATPGQYKDYYYPNAQNARTIWYHDHTEYRTGENVYRGQEGLYLIHDPEEQALALPSGNYDLPLSISAKTYNSDGSLWYNTNNNIGLWGDVIQINGQPWPYVPVEPRKYRLRILNGAVSRTFGLSFTAATEDVAKGESIGFTVIASDGGLFGAPVKTNYLAMAMGERYEIIFDFAQHRGQNITLRNARGMGENVDYAATDLVTRFVVGEEVTDWDNNGPVPPKLHDIPPANPSDTDKEFTFARVRGGRWNINGVGFADVENRILTRPERGKDEIWTLKNGAGDGTHPVHIHLIDFQVLERTGGRGAVRPYESAGMKDIVWLAGGETVKVLARYAPWPGVYMFHCHNLIHEDNDMLAAFDVAQLSDWGYDNSTMFIDPMTPEFRPKDATPDDFTDEAIREKLAWLYSTNPYNHGDIDGVYSALDSWETGGRPSPAIWPQATGTASSESGENSDGEEAESSVTDSAEAPENTEEAASAEESQSTEESENSDDAANQSEETQENEENQGNDDSQSNEESQNNEQDQVNDESVDNQGIENEQDNQDNEDVHVEVVEETVEEKVEEGSQGNTDKDIEVEEEPQDGEGVEVEQDIQDSREVDVEQEEQGNKEEPNGDNLEDIFEDQYEEDYLDYESSDLDLTDLDYIIR